MSQQITPQHLDIVIFDVEHGNCAFVQTPSGETMMLDCGHTSAFSPTELIFIHDWVNEDKLEKLVISHPDNDHISDIERTLNLLNPKRYQHPGLTSEQVLLHLQPKPNTALAHYHKITGFPNVPQYLFQGVEVAHFKTQELLVDGSGRLDTNHLSVVTFISYNGVTICFPGDITDKGLAKLLSESRNGKTFVEYLQQTEIFVAPHHGRVCEDDCHDETTLSLALNLMQPGIIIASDKAIEGQNENTAATDYYAGYVPNGMIFGRGTSEEETRKVLTTRNDGTLHITIPMPELQQPNQYTIRRRAFLEEREYLRQVKNRTLAS